MLDNGRRDEKIIAVPFQDPNYNDYKSIFSLPRHIYDEMRHFFSVYKALENKDTVVDEVLGPEDAVQIIQKGNWILSGKIRRNEVMQGRN